MPVPPTGSFHPPGQTESPKFNSGEWLKVRIQPSTVSGQPSALSGWPSAVGPQRLAFS
ncbi:MAG: hypothetical protein F6K63_07910 [Moorea sp. SIO1G6]|uniref:hypothetical protein n=1 Tax=Moorena sp. SIO1G6 TaxID=2607840 RepID=UPI0013C25CA8|nr:hypothetical protein [Moorena sp. SIO1G6]NET64311.1 hypothetical protein [Moorena sp. SIO1G6]